MRECIGDHFEAIRRVIEEWLLLPGILYQDETLGNLEGLELAMNVYLSGFQLHSFYLPPYLTSRGPGRLGVMSKGPATSPYRYRSSVQDVPWRDRFL